MLMLLTAVRSAAQSGMTVYQGQTTELAVADNGAMFVWDLYHDVSGVNFATTDGNCPPSLATFTGGNRGSRVNVNWLIPGVYFYKVTAYSADGCMNLKVGKVTVLASLPTALLDEIPPICVGDSATIVVRFTGTPPWNISLQADDGKLVSTTTYRDISTNIFMIPIAPKVTTSYTIAEVSDRNGTSSTLSNTVRIEVKPLPRNSRIYQYNPQARKD